MTVPRTTAWVVGGVIVIIGVAAIIRVRNDRQPPKSPAPSVPPTEQIRGTTMLNSPLPSPQAILYVQPNGSDTHGNGSRARPLRTIDAALARVKPGTQVFVTEGTYAESPTTRVNGTSAAPIQLTGVGRVVLKGKESDDRVLELRHDGYVIEGFEFTGGDVLLWMQEADNNTIRRNVFHHAHGECIRVKYLSTGNLLEHNTIKDCGLDDYVRTGGGKNGEAIYLGTAPEQRYKNPTDVVDETNENIIRNNAIVTNGNECVDMKEGTSKNVVEFNECSGQRDPESGGFSSRGNENIFRYNWVHDNIGAGIRLGGDAESDGIKNEVIGNDIANNGGVAIKITRIPQGRICGNTSTKNRLGFSNSEALRNRRCEGTFPSPGIQK